MKNTTTVAVVLLTLSTLASTAFLRAADTATPLPASACAGLQGLAIAASDIGLASSGAVVQSAVAVAAGEKGNVNGDFCKAIGIIKPKHPGSPNLEFEVNLPVAWNRRVLQMGGGGYDGTLVTGLTAYTLQPATMDTPLKQGFVTLGSDGGHKGGPGFDGSFGTDDEALVNYGKESVKKAHDAAEVEAMSEKDLGKRIKTLEKQMLEHARNLEFEKAARVRDQLALLKEQAFGASVHDNVPRWNGEPPSGTPTSSAAAANASRFDSGMFKTRMFCITVVRSVPSPNRSANPATRRSSSGLIRPDPTEKPA